MLRHILVRILYKSLLAVVMSLALAANAGAASSAANALRSTDTAIASGATHSADIAPSTRAAGGDPADTASALALAQASNAFASDLWQRLSTTPGNLAISPASLSIALAMTWGGAGGDTAQEMRRVLHVDADAKTAGKQWGSLVQALENPSRPLTLRIANRLFGEKHFSFSPAFIDETASTFGAALEPMDFLHAAIASSARINAWVEERTQHRIKNLLSPDAIGPGTRLVLVNAIYFLADWQQPFMPRSTVERPFHISAVQTKDVSTMHKNGSVRAAAVDGVKVLEMPYKSDLPDKGGDIAMLVILPNQVDGLAAVERKLSPATIDGWRKALARRTKSIVALPRFELNPAALSLGDELVAMGMQSAFDPLRADFTGMVNSKDPQDRLYVSAIYHKAFIKVDEKGTEAAAATAMVMELATARADPEPVFEFRADHPFLFLIIDQSSGLILFMGRVSDPAPAGA
jgi:serpin B